VFANSLSSFSKFEYGANGGLKAEAEFEYNIPNETQEKRPE
jgi:hypothetical protein